MIFGEMLFVFKSVSIAESKRYEFTEVHHENDGEIQCPTAVVCDLSVNVLDGKIENAEDKHSFLCIWSENNAEEIDYHGLEVYHDNIAFIDEIS